MSQRKHSASEHSAWYFFCVLAASIFAAETLIMLLFVYLPPLQTWKVALLDATLLLTVIFPILYFFVFRPLSRYITQRQDTETDLRVAAAAFESHESMMITNAKNVILRVNQAFTKNTGYSPQEIIGKTPDILKSSLHDAAFYAGISESLKLQGVWQGEQWAKRKNGEIYPIQLTVTAVRGKNNEVTHYVNMHSDLTDLRKAKGDVTRAGLLDPLTGLPNRLLFSERIHDELAENVPYRILAVVMIDLDNFKQINDTYGHEAGDKVLIEVAKQLNEATRDTDVVARLGGDEFVILLTELTGVEACNQTLERLRVSLSNPYMIEGLKLHLSASIGATLYPSDKTDADGLLRHADEAMYLAKHGGKNRYVIYDTTAAAKRSSLQQNLARIQAALDNQEFYLYYQPQVNMHEGTIVGMEALIRWKLAGQEIVTLPSEFMPLVENSELAIPIGCFVLKTAVTQLAKWHKLGLNWRIGINVSPRHLEHPNFINDIKDVLERHPEINPELIELEIVESAALEDIEKVIGIMQAVRAIGVHFALDDFGTGHASLTYLRSLPVRTLKIDQSFVRDMLEDSSDLIMVEGITSLAHTFDHEVLAEGVDNLKLGALLIQIGCQLAQGFAIAHPMPADEVTIWAKDWQPYQFWQQIGKRRWRRDDLPLLYAALAERIWVSQIQKLLDGDDTAIPELDPRRSQFGRWYYVLGSERYGVHPEFIAIRPIHEEMHKAGQTIVNLIEAKQQTDAQEQMHNLYDLRDKLITKMDLLSQRITLVEN
ncbi:MAG: EAL domain-containing protein [Methylotenera sp.]|uniref:EAL domain-containing protein n=1 Tax=Methylotenera sp. TaxID=2051956 RepID=UPI0017DD71C1|nr:EAL domain-containing protein [Methylotenera sp.]NOU25214.1 EAL domain-containing protein [Methylotenera sp.]